MKEQILSMRCSAESEHSEAILGMKPKETIVNNNGRSKARYAESKGQFIKTFFSKSDGVGFSIPMLVIQETNVVHEHSHLR